MNKHKASMLDDNSSAVDKEARPHAIVHGYRMVRTTDGGDKEGSYMYTYTSKKATALILWARLERTYLFICFPNSSWVLYSKVKSCMCCAGWLRSHLLYFWPSCLPRLSCRPTWICFVFIHKKTKIHIQCSKFRVPWYFHPLFVFHQERKGKQTLLLSLMV